MCACPHDCGETGHFHNLKTFFGKCVMFRHSFFARVGAFCFCRCKRRSSVTMAASPHATCRLCAHAYATDAGRMHGQFFKSLAVPECRANHSAKLWRHPRPAGLETRRVSKLLPATAATDRTVRREVALEDGARHHAQHSLREGIPRHPFRRVKPMKSEMRGFPGEMAISLVCPPFRWDIPCK